MISCILLSAGSSKRFGSPKALASTGDTSVIRRVQDTLIASKIDEIIVVLGDHFSQIKSHILNHKKVKVVHNKDYNLGQTSSFKTGLKDVSRGSTGIMLFPVDLPFVKMETINRLVDQFQKNAPAILIPTYKGKKGHPPIFNASQKEELLNLDNAVGLNNYEHEHETEIELFEVDDPGILRGFNTLEELNQIKSDL